MDYVSVTHDGITAESNTETEAAIRTGLGVETPDETVAADTTPAETETAAEKTARARDEAGKFTKTEADTAAEAKDAKADEAAKKTGKPRHDHQARIDQITAKEKEAVRRAEEAERRAEAAERRAAERDARPETARETAPAAAVPDKFAKLADWFAEPGNAEKGIDDYIEARDEWRETRATQKAAQAQIETRRQAQGDKVSAAFVAAKAADPAFEAKIAPALWSATPMSELAPGTKPTFANLAAEIAFWSETPADLLIRLSADGSKEAHRILALPPAQWERALISLDTELRLQRGNALPARNGPAAADTGSVRETQKSHAAPPIEPVRGSSVAAEDEGSEDESIDAYIRRENARERRRRA